MVWDSFIRKNFEEKRGRVKVLTKISLFLALGKPNKVSPARIQLKWVLIIANSTSQRSDDKWNINALKLI
jgi:hypothetical protein